MKLIRFGEPGKEKPGVIINEKRYDLSKEVKDYDEEFFGSGGIPKLKEYINKNHDNLVPVSDDVRLGAPLARPSKIICIGLNYVDHAKETVPRPLRSQLYFLNLQQQSLVPTMILLFQKEVKKLTGRLNLR